MVCKTAVSCLLGAAESADTDPEGGHQKSSGTGSGVAAEPPLDIEQEAGL